MTNTLAEQRLNDDVITTVNLDATLEGSDYGDFGEDLEELEIVDQLLAQIATDQECGTSLAITDIEDYEAPRGIRLPKLLGSENIQPFSTQAHIDIEVLRDGETAGASHKQSSPRQNKRSVSEEPVPSEPDNRPPIERFRRPPKKALSVTDLISPAWCELQYFYTLSKHGRKRRTPAMKQGSAVHQALEDETHITVPVEVFKIEDSWGLRIWNIIQGLRTLRETGRTRELEVWGTVGGEIVNGIIDELSYECPDPQYEENHASRQPHVELPEYQTSITDYLLSAGQKENGKSLEDAMKAFDPPKQEQEWIYITDVKTRNSPTLPAGSSIRPTILQLHLYHHMLENLAQGNFFLSQLADRYSFDVNEPFSDSLIAQLGSLNQDLFDNNTITNSQDQQQSASQPAQSQDSLTVLLQHNNLASLWELMMSQFQRTFILPSTPPQESSSFPLVDDDNNNEQPPTSTPQSTSDIPQPSHSHPTRLSTLLTAEYISPTYKHHNPSNSNSKTPNSRGVTILGRKSFTFNAAFLKQYLEDNLAWWRGQRPAKGVELQEAWKCRSCDFRDECEWILERDDAAFKLAVERKAMRDVAGVSVPTSDSDGDGGKDERKGFSPSKSRV